MKKYFSKEIIAFIFVATIFCSFCLFAYADSPCSPPKERGLQNSYTITVEPFEKEYRFE